MKSSDKILSLYEEQAAVYVRGKAGAEVEFGRQLLLGESESGVITDWELVLGNVKADTKMLDRSLDRLAKGLNAARLYGVDPKGKRNPVPGDYVDRLKKLYVQAGGPIPSNTQYGWVAAV